MQFLPLPRSSTAPSTRHAILLLLVPLCLLALPSAGLGQKLEVRSTFRPPVKGETFLYAAGFSRNNMTLAIACREGKNKVYILYDMETLQETDRWTSDSRGLPGTLLFSPNGKTLVVHSYLPTRVVGEMRGPSTLEFWDIELKKRVRPPLLLAPLEAATAHLTRDGKTVVLPGENHVLLVDARTGKPRTRFQAGYFGICPSALSPDGKYLALQERQRRCLGIYEIATGKRLHSLDPFPKSFFPNVQRRIIIAFTPDGKTLSVINNFIGAREMVDFDVVRGTESARRLVETHFYPRAIAYTADEKYLVQVGNGNLNTSLVALSPVSGKLTFPNRLVQCRPDRATISSDGRTVAILQNFPDYAIWLWRVESAKGK